MKKLFYILCCLPFLVSCNKDDGSIPSDQKRIKKVILSNDAKVDSTKVLYSYNNNLLVNRTIVVKSPTSYNSWDTAVICDYTYSGDIVTAISYFGEEDGLQLSEKVEYEFINGRMDRMKYYKYVDGDWLSHEEYFFNFDGELLTSFNYYFDLEDNGVLHEYSVGEYTYDNQNVTRIRVKDLYNDVYFYNEDFEYKNGVLNKWVSSENYRLTNIWRNLYQEFYEYNSENFLEKIKVYKWQNSWKYNYIITLIYDQNNLIMEDYSAGVCIDYIYEDGIGNSEQLIFTPMDRVYNSPVIENIFDESLKARYQLGNRHNFN